ncbi:hypothetical protein EWI07_11015 [Sporolactobacillus sp. THM7-4]|nr:hypothetical protein EWI07_11015 [Sporolactobacillus sp. THM7-4]
MVVMLAELKTEHPAHWMIKMGLLYQAFKEHGDKENAGKLREWYKKTAIDQNRTLAFCGHFSAGKSSLLNKIMQNRMLPSSPIPTSGNLVCIKSGAPSVRLETHDGETVTLPEHYPLEKLHDLLKNSDSISRIDVQIDSALPHGVELLDTPGVDSTDERHRRATHDALYLADTVFYVTDYNHVLSDINFNFMKTLDRLGKPFYLIVNQIDKHNDKEGTFASFKAHIDNVLKNEHLHPEKVFYLSLVKEDLSNNDLFTFLNFLKERTDDTGTSVFDQKIILKGLQALTGEHRLFLKDQFDRFLEQKHIDTVPDDATLQKWTDDVQRLQSEAARLAEQERSWLDRAAGRLTRAIESAILMPYEVREAARFYLASLDRQFKMGLFSTRKKIENERARRLNLFFENYQKQEQTLEWAVKDTLVRICRDTEMINESDIGLFSGLSEDDLKQAITAPLTGSIETNSAYLMHYADKVADLTKQKMRKKAMTVIYDWEPLIHERSSTKAAHLKQLIREKTEKLHILQETVLKKREWLDADRQLDAIFSDEPSFSDKTEAVQTLAQEIAEKESRKQILTIEDYLQKYSAPITGGQEKQPEEDTGDIRDGRKKENEIPFSESDWYQKLTQAAAILRPIDGFQDAADDLVQSAERLKQKTFTIALFGAFSAGKSSFANALLGEMILPVSPNPTTAVINSIKKSTADHPNRSAVVRFKEKETLLDEVNQSLALFDRHINDLAGLRSVLPLLEDGHHGGAKRSRITLLRALADAIDSFTKKWGGSYEMTLAESRQMVANEKIACLIESVTMYVDCPFTKQGNVLVDTPGSGSIHSRHTEVAFHYIKYADAILFLTYFNHAFSRADREFLIQLGRVKGTFSLDKMFFIINAIDLARTDQEKNDVIAYVKSQLQTFGIRNPKLYGVSSKLALQEQSNAGRLDSRPSGIETFRNDWNAFADKKLMIQVAKSGLKIIRQSTERITRLLSDLQLEGAEKEKRIQELLQLKNHVSQSLEQIPVKKKTPEMNQHIDEWFFYIKKRLIQRYIDEFSRFFEPTHSNKAFLHEGLKNCLDFLSFDLDQECRAAFLRVEALLKREWSNIYEKYEQISDELVGSAGIAASEPAFSHPLLPVHLKDINTAPLTSVFKIYKNPKQFFEKGGKKLMRDKLQELLDPHLTNIIDQYAECCKSHYLPLFYKEAMDLTERYKKEADQAADNHIRILQKNHQPMIRSLNKSRKDLIDLIGNHKF